MNRVYIVLISILTIGCYKQPKNGVEIPNGRFEALIKTKKVKHLAYLTREDLFEIELTDEGLMDFADNIDELKQNGGIKDISKFRAFTELQTSTS